jgi:hypothetical protein
MNSLDKAINNLIDVNKGKKINYFSYNLNDSPNGMDKNDKVDDNLNQMLRNNEAADNGSAVNISESELEKHLILLDIILEMEIVKFKFNK